MAGDTLYGTAAYGGSWGNGTVFALGTNGTDFVVLHTFSALYSYDGPQTNSDGANPIRAGLIVLVRAYGVWGNNALAGQARMGVGSENSIRAGIYWDGAISAHPRSPVGIRIKSSRASRPAARRLPIPSPETQSERDVPAETISHARRRGMRCQTGIKCSDLTVRMCRLKR